MLCMIAPDRAAAPEVPRPAKKPARVPDLRKVKLAPRSDLRRLTLDVPAKRDPSEIEMPWIWRALRERVHSQLPSHHSEGFALTMSPVVVTTPSETVPGLGVAGDF